ncbi:MAG: hypothetical protein IJ326_03175 [Lachnospiraceae bacterium]|nr:hypothetical protein [Lachnospiraceae bacterium]
MTGKEIYKVWAPVGKKWVDWVRPVPFVGINEYSVRYSGSNNALPVFDFVDETCTDAALIVDLHGTESVKAGIALAQAGYRPIPVYNGTVQQQGARATVDNQAVQAGLIWGAAELCKLEIGDDALPAFLLDSNRMHRFKMEISLFDNSWDLYPQDIPSAEYFLENGIHKIIIVGDKISKDLKKILYKFQKKNIQILWTNGYETPKKTKLLRPFDLDKD